MEEVLNATGMRTKDYRAIMSEKGYRVAIGVTACGKGGHTMRGANGHCVVCKPANLMYRKRYREDGYVYVASTKERAEIIKIGYCQNVQKREYSLNSSQYGGYCNWKVRASCKVKQKGQVEHAMHKHLAAYSFSKSYTHDGKEQKATELFKYDVDKAINLLRQLTEDFECRSVKGSGENTDSFKTSALKDSSESTDSFKPVAVKGKTKLGKHTSDTRTVSRADGPKKILYAKKPEPEDSPNNSWEWYHWLVAWIVIAGTIKVLF